MCTIVPLNCHNFVWCFHATLTQNLHFRLHTFINASTGYNTNCLHQIKYNIHPFNDPLSGTTRVRQYQKGKTNLDFTEARESEWQWHQLGHMQVCTSLQTDNPPLSFITGQIPFLLPNQQDQSTEGKSNITVDIRCSSSHKKQTKIPSLQVKMNTLAIFQWTEQLDSCSH